MDFTKDKLVFVQSHVHARNFIIDKHNKICILDFEAVGLLPESFASYTMHRGNSDFVKKVAQYLNWPYSPNEHSMARALQTLWTIADPTLGT